MTSTVKPFLYYLKNEKEGLELVSEIKKRVNRSTSTCLCGEKMKIKYSPKEYPYNVGENEKTLVILETPYFECKRCERKTEDVFLYANVEKSIEREIFLRLNNRESIPEQVDFSVFISDN